MLPTFVIGLREGVEAALIVGIIAAFLRQDPRGRGALKFMWIGVVAAIGICVAAGVALEILNQDLPQRQQEGLETVIATFAVGAVTFMILWMRKHARTISKDLRASAAGALASGTTGALVGMAFFAVIREGLETVVFLLAVFQNSDSPTSAGIGALLGILVAVCIGTAIYRGGVKLNLARFFRITGVVLVFVAAGLVASALHTAHEAGWLTVGQQQAFDLQWLVVPGTWTASLLTGMLGLQPLPVVAEVVGYVVYAVPMLLFLLLPDALRARMRRSSMQSATTAVLLVLVAGVLLAACGNSDKTVAGAKQVAMKLTDAGCDPATLKLDAGPTTFEVTNGGTARVSEFELLDGSKILGEKENLAPGLKGNFTLTLQPGNYTLSCPGGQTTATGDLTVGGSKVAASSDKRLTAAVTGYQSYVKTQAALLRKRVAVFVAAVKAGDTARAKSLFAAARFPYEAIEPVAESFGNLDPKIDARVNDVAEGDKWTGFHRIEQTLWQKDTTKGMASYATGLVADVQHLYTLVQKETYQPDQLANGATSLLDEVSKSKITGEEDRYSHTDLSDFEANVNGAQTAFGLLAPALRDKNAALVSNIEKRFAAVQSELARIKVGGRYPSYETVGQAQRRKFSQLVDALAEPLSQVAAKLHA
ncbi:MAG TPA: iron uptake system protein EfeO [Solirubrobacteraceae bacterium]|nr:iron uptake system protein EfeO [Solirubrobacteraceae bacterium]